MADVAPPTAVGLLAPDEVTQVLAAAVAVPSLHNSQPWRFALSPAAIELYADPPHGLQLGDPDHQAVHLACGATLMNLRLAIRARGVLPEVQLFPDASDPFHLARVSCDRSADVDPVTRRLAAAIPLRHTYRRAMLDVPVPDELRAALHLEAREESAWLVEFATEQLSEVRDLVTQAHRAQQSDEAFVAEWRSWTGRPAGSVDGVPMTAGGFRPEPQDMWVVRDFSGGAGKNRPLGRDFESDPLLVCVSTFVDGHLAQVQAGAALQRVLLRAAAEGVTASFLSQLIEVPAARSEVRRLIGGALWPQAVLRLGYGGLTPVTPRRPLTAVTAVTEQGRSAAER